MQIKLITRNIKTVSTQTKVCFLYANLPRGIFLKCSDVVCYERGVGCFLKGKLYESLRESCGKVSAAMLWVADAILRVVVGGIKPWGTIDGSESNKIVSASIFDCI